MSGNTTKSDSSKRSGKSRKRNRDHPPSNLADFDMTSEDRLTTTTIATSSKRAEDPATGAAAEASKEVERSSMLQPFPFLPLAKLRLEAVFYPKFENENRHTQSVRQQMKDLCRSKAGYLEATLKHSGSLLLWSGGRRYYSKNSTANKFTAVGEVLLRQHFVRAFDNSNGGNTNNKDAAHDSKMIGDGASPKRLLGEIMYEECSAHVQEHRLTLSFEVVTSVLGDHGARPLRDFMVLTAVADRSRAASLSAAAALPSSSSPQQQSLFYSTVELIEFAQRFRLPHNDCWVYTSEPAVDALFHLYDTQQETGTTSTVVPALTHAAAIAMASTTTTSVSSVNQESDDSACDYYVQSMYPHDVFQGEILEGIVIRFIPCVDQETAIARMKHLARQSRAILEAVPPTLPDCYELMQSNQHSLDSDAAAAEATTTGLPAVLSVNLRQLHLETKAAWSFDSTEFEARLKELVPPISSGVKQSAPLKRTCLPIWIDNLWKGMSSTTSSDQHNDIETRRITAVIQLLTSVSKNVTYSIFKEQRDKHSASGEADSEPNGGTSDRYICVVHVLHDKTFQQFHKRKNVDSLPLFRGFSFEMLGQGEDDNGTSLNALSLSDDKKIQAPVLNGSDLRDEPSDEPNQSLMLKMKFLPYMVRTFVCRNGLVHIKKGPAVFSEFFHELFSKWGISENARLHWMPFVVAWGHYAHATFRNMRPKEAADLPPLSDFFYLDHLALAQNLQKEGKLTDVGTSKSLLQGLVIVVAMELDKAAHVADFLAEQLGGTQRADSLDQVNNHFMAVVCNQGQGCVCTTSLETIARKGQLAVLKDCSDFINVVMYHCSEEAISSRYPDDDAVRGKCLGSLKWWRKMKWARFLEVPGRTLPRDDNKMDVDDGNSALGDELSPLLLQLQQSLVVDKRPGILVFFPTIPGSGKSSCLEGVDNALRECLSNRHLIVQEGDKTKGDFWSLVRRTRQCDYGSVYIADKNTPAATWLVVGDICAATKALAVPVLPDASVLRTTRVVGLRGKGGYVVDHIEHVYPFSLRYLAVCITRVVDRLAGSHPGKLDQATPRAGLIVVGFYALYRSIRAEDFVDYLTKKCKQSGALVAPNPIEVPFFSELVKDMELPADLEQVLLEALRCQYGYEQEGKTAMKAKDEYLDDLEERLRASVQLHRDSILRGIVEMSVVRETFQSAMKEKIAEVNAITSYETHSYIKLAAIDIDVRSVHRMLTPIFETDASLRSFVQTVFGNSSVVHTFETRITGGTDFEDVEELGFEKKTHVTLAHYRESSQADMTTKFGAHVGTQVSVSATGLFWNEEVMALQVDVLPNETSKGSESLPRTENAVAHVTVWSADGISSFEANSLFSKGNNEAANTALRIIFESPILLTGTVSFWRL